MKRLWLNRQTSYADRSGFVRMSMSGMSARAIARKSGISVTTVCRWVNRWKLERNLASKRHTKNNKPKDMRNWTSHTTNTLAVFPSHTVLSTPKTKSSCFMERETCLSDYNNSFNKYDVTPHHIYHPAMLNVQANDRFTDYNHFRNNDHLLPILISKDRTCNLWRS